MGSSWSGERRSEVPEPLELREIPEHLPGSPWTDAEVERLVGWLRERHEADRPSHLASLLTGLLLGAIIGSVLGGLIGAFA